MTTKCNYNSVARPIVFCLHCILCLLTLSNCKMLLVCRMFFVFQFLYLVSVIHDLFHWWLFNMLEPYVHILATKRIVLASMSPRRKQILENIVCFSVNIVHILIFLLLLVLIVVYRVFVDWWYTQCYTLFWSLLFEPLIVMTSHVTHYA